MAFNKVELDFYTFSRLFHRVSMSCANRPMATLIAQVGFTVNDAQSARSGAVQAHLPVTGADLGITTRSRMDIDLMELHRAVKKSGQIARHDVFVAAAESARPGHSGAKGLASVAAVMSIFSTDLWYENS